MIKLTLKIFLMLMVACACSHDPDKTNLPEKALSSLDRVMAGSGRYTAVHAQKLDSMKNRLLKNSSGSGDRIDMLISISKAYRQNMADSALLFSSMAAEEAASIGDSRRIYRSRLAFADALVAAGFFSQAIIHYDSLDNVGVDRDTRIEYFKVGRRLYSSIGSYVDDKGYMASYYEEKYVECDDSLINLMDADDPLRRFIIGERLVASGKFGKAKEVLESQLSSLDSSSNIYGMAAYQLATVYRSDGDMTSYAAYLAKAAESDILANVKEGFALPALAAWLYDRGEFSRAFKYINYALEDAYRGNARVRMVSMARWVPAIDEAYRHEISTSRNEWFAYAAFASMLIIALGIVTFFLLKQTRKSRARQKALASTSQMKDSYIGNFIGLCSTYSEKYHALLKLIDRKISSGQASDLLKSIKSGKLGEEENGDFYKEIDSVVLTLYPDFVEKINRLLLPSEQVRIIGNQLTPELRIYAFVRLGVNESVRIARILNYSVNTVYAYRNRMRNRAIDREHFDENVLKIGSEDNNEEFIF